MKTKPVAGHNRYNKKLHHDARFISFRRFKRAVQKGVRLLPVDRYGRLELRILRRMEIYPAARNGRRT